MKIPNEVLDILGNCQMVGNALTITQQLDRKMYDAVNEVLEAAGGKWNRKAKAHLFDGEAAEAMDQIILTGEIATLDKNPLEYFPTPKPVVDLLIELAGIRPGMTVLEPSAGRGAIVLALTEAGATVDTIDIDHKHYEFINTLKPANGKIRTTFCGDFLWFKAGGELGYGYDRVVMNPPFGRQADIKHVTHAIQMKFLKPGGLLVAVMSNAVTFRTDRATKAFREMLYDRGGEIKALPEGSFKSSGTMVNTVIVTIPA